MTIVLNTPTCRPCAGDTPASSGLAPFHKVDAGRLTLVADVPQTVAFVNIHTASATGWVMPKAECLGTDGTGVPFDVTAKTGSGFTVTAVADCTFEYFCIKI